MEIVQRVSHNQDLLNRHCLPGAHPAKVLTFLKTYRYDVPIKLKPTFGSSHN